MPLLLLESHLWISPSTAGDQIVFMFPTISKMLQGAISIGYYNAYLKMTYWGEVFGTAVKTPLTVLVS